MKWDSLGETEGAGHVRGGPGLGLQVAGHGEIVVLANLQSHVLQTAPVQGEQQLVPGSCMCTSCWLVSSSYLLTWQPSCNTNVSGKLYRNLWKIKLIDRWSKEVHFPYTLLHYRSKTSGMQRLFCWLSRVIFFFFKCFRSDILKALKLNFLLILLLKMLKSAPLLLPVCLSLCLSHLDWEPGQPWQPSQPGGLAGAAELSKISRLAGLGWILCCCCCYQHRKTLKSR